MASINEYDIQLRKMGLMAVLCDCVNNNNFIILLINLVHILDGRCSCEIMKDFLYVGVALRLITVTKDYDIGCITGRGIYVSGN